MGSGSFVSINHGIGLNQHHMEWAPKYRFKCMRKPEIAKEMEQILRQIASDKGILIHDIAVDADHIHIFVSLPFSMSVSKAIQFLKGGSAYQIFRSHPNFRKRYWGGHFWSCGHFSRSISNVTSKAIDNYIRSHDTVRLNETVAEGRIEARQLSLANFQ